MCRGCGKQSVFSESPKAKFPVKIAKISSRLRHRGLKLKYVKKSISEIFEIPVKAISTIWYWSQKYVDKFSQTIQGLGERLYADETKLKMYKKGEYLWFWAVRDLDTHCIVGWYLSKQRTLQDAKFLFWETKRKFPIGYMPKYIRTDKLPSYNRAIKKVFNHEVNHEKVISFKHGNNVIENFWRCKRSFPRFRTIKSAGRYISAVIYEYNTERLKISYILIIRR